MRVKSGYNPNSSSMGSIVFVLPVALLLVNIIFGIAAGLLAPLLLRRFNKKEWKSPCNWAARFFVKKQNKNTHREIKRAVKK